MALQPAVVIVHILVEQREETLMYFRACESLVEWSFQVRSADAVDGLGRLGVREGDFRRAEADDGAILMMERVDTVGSVASEDLVLEAKTAHVAPVGVASSSSYHLQLFGRLSSGPSLVCDDICVQMDARGTHVGIGDYWVPHTWGRTLPRGAAEIGTCQDVAMAVLRQRSSSMY